MRRWRTSEPVRAKDAVDGLAPLLQGDALGGAVANRIDSSPPFDLPKGTVTPKGVGRSRLMRWARDVLAGMALVMIAPIAILAFAPKASLFPRPSVDASASYERSRLLTQQTDPSVSAREAGEALARVLPTVPSGNLVARFAADAEAQLQEITEPDSLLFASLARSRPHGMPDHMQLLSAAAGDLLPEEREWLRRMAELSLWRDVDLVARATAVDMVSTRFDVTSLAALPSWERPGFDNQQARRVAQAGVARAGWHVSRGDLAAAEDALRSVVSLGFALLDNYGGAWDFQLGESIVRIGKDGLYQLALLRGVEGESMRQLAMREPQARANRLANRSKPSAFPVDSFLASLRNPNEWRALRMARAGWLPLTTCSTLRGVLLGETEAERQAAASLRQELARSPEELRLISMDVLAQLADLYEAREPLSIMAFGSAQIVSSVTGNPRIAQCMAPTVSRW